MIKIYTLCFGDRVFYVGQSSKTTNRIKAHLSGTDKIKDLPEWVKAHISMKIIEECDNAVLANLREKYWINFFLTQKCQLLNKMHARNGVVTSNGIAYQELKTTEIEFIKRYCYLPRFIGFSGIQGAKMSRMAGRGRIKLDLYEVIFSGETLRLYRHLYEKHVPSRRKKALPVAEN